MNLKSYFKLPDWKEVKANGAVFVTKDGGKKVKKIEQELTHENGKDPAKYHGNKSDFVLY